MRFLALIFGLLLPVAAAASPGVEQQIKSLEAAVNNAYQANDLPKYFSYHADDFRGLFPEGINSKSDYVKSWTAFIKSGGRIEKFTYTDLVVQVGPSGDAAVPATTRWRGPKTPASRRKTTNTMKPMSGLSRPTAGSSSRFITPRRESILIHARQWSRGGQQSTAIAGKNVSFLKKRTKKLLFPSVLFLNGLATA